MTYKQIQNVITKLESKRDEANSKKDHYAYLEDWPTANHYAGEVKGFAESIKVLQELFTKKINKRGVREMKKVMTVLFYINLICWVSFMIINCIVKTDLLRTLFLVFNATMTFFGAWIAGYYYGVYKTGKPRLYLPLEKQAEDHSLDALEYAKKVCDNEERVKHDEIAQIVVAQRIYNQAKKKVCRKCVNCKHCVNDNYCDLFDGRILQKNRFTSCRRFKAKDL